MTTRTGRLLVVDDEAELLNALCEFFREEGFEVAGFTDPSAALDVLSADRFDVLLSDLMMPGMDGLQLLGRTAGIDPDLVGVIMTGQGSIPTAVEALRSGAVDFVLKPFKLGQVLEAIDRAMTIRRKRSETRRSRREAEEREGERVRLLEEANARLTALAALDPLTGLANRRTFDDTLTREVALAGRGVRPVSLVLFDLDSFKGFNDTFGHPAGDDVLRTVGAIIQGCCRGTDLAARLGGEEFALLLPGTAADGAKALAERVRQAVESASWPLRPVTVSAGVATLTDDRGSGEWLVGAADRALYRAKQNGRNRTEVSTE